MKGLYIILLMTCLSFSGYAQEKKGKPILKDWESTYYYSYFGKYYYGYHNGIGAADLGLEIGTKGWGFDFTTWFHNHFGAGVGFGFGTKGELGLSLIFAYSITPKWQVDIAPVIRFIQESSEKEKHVGIGADIDLIYYYWKNIGIKVGYSSTTNFTLGANFRISNYIFER